MVMSKARLHNAKFLFSSLETRGFSEAIQSHHQIQAITKCLMNSDCTDFANECIYMTTLHLPLQ